MNIQNVMRVLVVASLAFAGCVSVENIRSQMSSSDPNDIASGEKEIVSIALTGVSSDELASFTPAERIEVIKMAAGRPIAWNLAKELSEPYRVPSNDWKMSERNVLFFIEALKGCSLTDEKTVRELLTMICTTRMGNENQQKVCNALDGNLKQALPKLSKEQLFSLASEHLTRYQMTGTESVGILCYATVKEYVKKSESDEDVKKIFQDVYLCNICPEVKKVALTRISNPTTFLKLYLAGKIPIESLPSVIDELTVVEWLVAQDVDTGTELDRLADVAKKYVKTDSALVRLAKAKETYIGCAAVRAMSRQCFANFVKEEKSLELFRARIGEITAKEELFELLSILDDEERVLALATRMKKIGMDLGEVAVKASVYSDVTLWAFYNTENEELLKKMSKEHKLKLLRYMALDKIDKASAAAMATAEAAKVKAMTGTCTVDGFGIDMSIEDAFFMALQKFPELKPEICRESADTFRVVVTDGGDFTFATANYNSGKVIRLNFTPSMTKKLVGGKTYDEQCSLLATKYGFEFKFEVISARLHIENPLLKFLCKEDDDKWSVAHQSVYQQLGTDGIRVRYYEDEPTESAGFWRLLAANATFREIYSNGWTTPEREAEKLAKQCANDFETVLGKPGTLRMEKVK